MRPPKIGHINVDLDDWRKLAENALGADDSLARLKRAVAAAFRTSVYKI